MLNKIISVLTSIPATVIGGIFLILSFVLDKTGSAFILDPAYITVIICGLPILYSTIQKLIYNRGISKISSALLISIAMIAAIAIGDLFAAGEVAFIMALGEILEDMTTSRAKKGLKALVSLAPTQGRRLLGDKEEIISAEDIKKGDILRVLPGEIIPVDGIIISGETAIDQSVITGESLPVDKTLGDEVFCGTLNQFGVIDIKAVNVGEDSSLKKLIRLVEEAENNKAPMARTADKAASYLVPAALIVAIITWLVTKDIIRAVTVLVVFCPCSLVLATPTAIMAAIGQATKHGVVIKSGEALEKMSKVDTVAFDKTGTLTHGTLEVCDIIPFKSDIDETELLLLAASIEAKSEHPLGKAIVSFASNKGVVLSQSTDFKMSAGYGISAHVGGQRILVGSERYLLTESIVIESQNRSIAEALRLQGKASVLVAQNNECIGIIALCDVLRKEAQPMVEKLNAMGTNAVLLTGDNRITAEYFASKAGIGEIYAELLPEQKSERILALQKSGHSICMIGDGVNDAIALKTADVGIAMGSMGSDISVEAADIALMRDDISKIPYLKRLSSATVNTVKLSISLSMFINLLAVILSVTGILNPTTGALVHNAGSCFVVLIAALLYDRKLI